MRRVPTVQELCDTSYDRAGPWLPPRLIPNRDAKRVVVMLNNGVVLVTQVIRGIDGLYRLRDVPIERVTSYREPGPYDEDQGVLHNTCAALEGA